MQLVSEPDTAFARKQLRRSKNPELGAVMLVDSRRPNLFGTNGRVVPVGVRRREHVVHGEPLIALVRPRVSDPPVHRHAREGVPGRCAGDALADEIDRDRLLERHKPERFGGAVVRDLAAADVDGLVPHHQRAKVPRVQAAGRNVLVPLLHHEAVIVHREPADLGAVLHVNDGADGLGVHANGGNLLGTDKTDRRQLVAYHDLGALVERSVLEQEPVPPRVRCDVGLGALWYRPPKGKSAIQDRGAVYIVGLEANAPVLDHVELAAPRSGREVEP